MVMFDWGEGREVRVETITPELTSPIDFILDEELVSRIYDTWDEESYGPLMDYGGGVMAITGSMLIEAGSDFLCTLRGIGVKKASQILESVEATMAEVPYI